jgi:hypothetical protein
MEKGVDKRGMVWYSKQALHERAVQNREMRTENSAVEPKKVLDKLSWMW